MPGFCFLRQWGAIPTQFMAAVEKQTIEAVRRAKADLAPAELALGKSRVAGGNHNRTVKTCKTDEKFTADSTDEERWLDTMLHALVFHRGGKRTLVWYHFSAHAVCYADERAGPDWPGMVADLLRQNEGLDPSKRQIIYAHCVAPTRMFGPAGPSNPFEILSHSEDRRGASVRSFLPQGYMTTTLEIHPGRQEILCHRAKAVDNLVIDRACRTKLAGEVVGDVEKLFTFWDQYGWHRVTFYGDLREPVKELAAALEFRFVEEA